MLPAMVSLASSKALLVRALVNLSVSDNLIIMPASMSEANPYQAPRSNTVPTFDHRSLPSKAKWALVGAALFASPPIAHGFYLLQHNYEYMASLGPNEAACGMGGLAALVVIFVIGPICGIIGASLGWAAVQLRIWSSRRTHEVFTTIEKHPT